MAIDAGVFRAYDIRGKVGPSLTAEFAELLGKAFGTRRSWSGKKSGITPDDLRDLPAA